MVARRVRNGAHGDEAEVPAIGVARHSKTALSPAAPIGRLRRLALSAPVLGDDGRWLADRLRTYLDARGGLSLDEALGVAVLPGGEHWAAAEARQRRDAAIRDLARIMPDASARAVGAALLRYGASRWRHDQALATMPDAYRGTERAAMFAAYHSGGGKVPTSERQLRAILRGNQIDGFHCREDVKKCESKKKEPAA
ncbi:MAG: hypothetical protein WA733_12460 [Methylocystis sp.]